MDFSNGITGYAYVQTHQNVDVKYVQFFLYLIYLEKAKKKKTKQLWMNSVFRYTSVFKLSILVALAVFE